MFWFWIACWFVAAFVSLWIWHRFCRLNGFEAAEASQTHPDYRPYGMYVPEPAQASPKPRRPVKYDHVPRPCCGKLGALTTGGDFHRRRHVCRILKPASAIQATDGLGHSFVFPNEHNSQTITATVLTEPEPKEAA